MEASSGERIYILPLYRKNLARLYDYVEKTFRNGEIGQGTFNNARHEFMGFFGHVKLMEAQVYLYKATGEERYLRDLRDSLLFCQEHRVNNGIDDWWSRDYSQRSNWLESNHLGILALVIYEYYRATDDGRFNAMAIDLMEKIPQNGDGSGTFLDGYDDAFMHRDDNRYLADHSEILAGWWACYELTGKQEYLDNYHGIFNFFDRNFRMIDGQDRHPAWLVGPRHITYGEGTLLEYCDNSHTTYSQFFIARDIMLAHSKERYPQLVTAARWMQEYARFPDGLVGYNRREDKMLGWSAYATALFYWVYLVSGDASLYYKALDTLHTVLAHQDTERGCVIPHIRVEGRINWDEMESNRAGLGEIWQETACLEGFSITESVGRPLAASVQKQTDGPALFQEAYFERQARVDGAFSGGRLVFVVAASRALHDCYDCKETFRVALPAGHFRGITVNGVDVDYNEGMLWDGRVYAELVVPVTPGGRYTVSTLMGE